MVMIQPPRTSGIQQEIFKLYRLLLRTAYGKKDPKLYGFVKVEFRRQASKLSKFDFDAIEHGVRHGYKQVKLMKMPGFSTAGHSS
jgi:hypothetical protein